jgi:hypothetical protein
MEELCGNQALQDHSDSSDTSSLGSGNLARIIEGHTARHYVVGANYKFAAATEALAAVFEEASSSQAPSIPDNGSSPQSPSTSHQVVDSVGKEYGDLEHADQHPSSPLQSPRREGQIPQIMDTHGRAHFDLLNATAMSENDTSDVTPVRVESSLDGVPKPKDTRSGVDIKVDSSPVAAQDPSNVQNAGGVHCELIADHPLPPVAAQDSSPAQDAGSVHSTRDADGESPPVAAQDSSPEQDAGSVRSTRDADGESPPAVNQTLFANFSDVHLVPEPTENSTGVGEVIDLDTTSRLDSSHSIVLSHQPEASETNPGIDPSCAKFIAQNELWAPRPATLEVDTTVVGWDRFVDRFESGLDWE